MTERPAEQWLISKKGKYLYCLNMLSGVKLCCLSERIYFNCKKLLSTSAEVTDFCYAFYFFKLKSLYHIYFLCLHLLCPEFYEYYRLLCQKLATYPLTFHFESEGLYEICKIGNKYEITAERLFLHDFMDYFYCSRFLFFKTAGDFLYLCNIHRIVENSREPCTPPSQR
ncbi:hypothetical protein T05_15804 [Trichinella murrelli]|uniref:Uncharacterized protein n=1 Tax=Trichinella murrelli TaxID=144512 RepID=A0A0V0TWL1_9BILA|nr:hypothetical protein T05_15804 [Trichinella murrelli]